MNYRLFHILASVMLMTLSCSKSDLGQEEMIQQDGLYPIVTMPSMGVSDTGWPTKALINSATDLQGYSISLFASAVAGGNTYFVFDNEELSYSNQSGWGYNGLKYWISGAKYTFGAFCPSAISNGDVSYSNGVLTIQNYITGKTGTFDARCEDLLYTSVVRDNRSSNDYSAVNLQMEHLLACVEFQVRNASANEIVKIDNIYLTGPDLKDKADISVDFDSNIVTRNDCISGEDTFKGEDRTGTPFLPAGMGADNYVSLFDCDQLTVLPQSIYGKNIYIVFTTHKTDSDIDGTLYDVNLGNIESITEWEAGKKYRYKFTINSKDITFQVSEVPWIEHNINL